MPRRRPSRRPAGVPWEHGIDDDWVLAVDSAPWEQRDRDEWIKIVPCPRCGHTMSVRHESGYAGLVLCGYDIVLADLQTPRPAPESTVFIHALQNPQLVPARCNCQAAHEGRPETIAGGCGRWGAIQSP